jgi:hypothetical protein
MVISLLVVSPSSFLTTQRNATLSSVFGTEEMTSTGEAGVTELPVYIRSAISMSDHEPFGAFLCHLVVLAAGFAVTVALMFRLVPDFTVLDELAKIDTVGARIS